MNPPPSGDDERCAGVEIRSAAVETPQDVGLPHVVGDILICIDADTVIDVDVVEKFVNELEAGADATCANMLPMPSNEASGSRTVASPTRWAATGGAGHRPRWEG
jgi:Glycosyl transferase family 2